MNWALTITSRRVSQVRLQSHVGKFDLIINTTNVALPWDDYIAMLAPKGILHTVGAAPKIEATVFPLIIGQKSLSSSPTGNIVTLHRMLFLCSTSPYRAGDRTVCDERHQRSVRKTPSRLTSLSACTQSVIRAQGLLMHEPSWPAKLSRWWFRSWASGGRLDSWDFCCRSCSVRSAG